MKLFSSLNMRGNRILDCPDTEINGQKPTYTEAAKLENISSGETVKVAFGKLRKAVDVLMAHYAQKATASILGHVKLSNSAAITTAGEYALDAIEKNASVNGTLANQIGTINGSLQSKVSSNSDPELYNRIKYLIDNKKLPTGTPFMKIENSYGNYLLIGHIYDNYQYGEILIIQHLFKDSLYVACIDGGVLRLEKATTDV